MNRIFKLIIILNIILIFIYIPASSAYEFSGYVSAEGTAFFHDPLFTGQERNSLSLALQPELYQEMEDGSSFIFTPFIRLDSVDSERTHFDVRELNYLWLKDDWELRVGIGKVFWGVTEFIHLVDIINQTDLVEDISMEEKLGQPMVHLSIPREWGTLDLFVLPYFRERTFPGEDGRLRSEIIIDTDSAEYKSSLKDRHIDFAVRYSHTIGDWDFGLYHFKGTGREPTLQLDTGSGSNVLIPFYEQIDQTGIDVQAVKGNWLLKLESIYRTGQGDRFFAGAGGFEYSFVNIASSGIDLGLISEWGYDERGEDATTIFDNDLIFGMRLAINDAAGTEAILGIIEDLDDKDRLLSLESSRRIGDNLKASINALFIVDSSGGGVNYSLRDDDYVQLKMTYYF